MFSWSKKKDIKTKGRSERDSEENKFGINFDKNPDDEQLEAELKRLAGFESLPEDDVNGGEEDVETELLRLIGGGNRQKKSKKQIGSEETVGNISELTADINLGDEDVEVEEVDENDPELLEELLELTNADDAEIEEKEVEFNSESEDKSSGENSDIMITLKDRLKLYKTAEAKARENNESSRARRFLRGIKSLEDLLKKAKLGKAVSPNDIPPLIAINLKPIPLQLEMPQITNEMPKEPDDLSHQDNSTVTVQDVASLSESENIMKILTERLELYQIAEAKANECRDISRAKKYGREIKILESLIKQAQAGKQVVFENIPPIIALNLKPAPIIPVKTITDEDKIQDETEGISTTDLLNDKEEKRQDQSQERNIIDVLSERLQMYETAEAKAKEDGETSRARRFGRGIKILQDLIKQAKVGKPIASGDIPPVVALNLKPAPLVTVNKEERIRELSVEREKLVLSSDSPEKSLIFTTVEDDIENVNEELEEVIPTTVLEGLEQRLRFYSKFQEKARQEGDLALVDQNETIVKTYLDAIKVFKKGGYIDVERLPNPKGCPPIPIPFFVP